MRLLSSLACLQLSRLSRRSLSTQRQWPATVVPTPVVEALRRQGAATPTTFQQDALHALVKGSDAALLAETGCGKTYGNDAVAPRHVAVLTLATIAYLLPTISRLITARQTIPQSFAVVAVPTSELAMQVPTKPRSAQLTPWTG